MRTCLCAAAAVALTVQSAWAATGDPAVDALINKLVERKILSTKDAAQLEQEVKRPLSRDKKNVTEEGGTGAANEVQGTTAKKESSTVKSKLKLPFELKIRGQTRLDAGHLMAGSDGTYRTQSDLYLRRVRLEVDKELSDPPLGKKIDFNLTLEADRFEQDFRDGRRRDPSNDVGLQYLYLDWVFTDQFALQIGKRKLPFLRTELTSSSRQLMIERPAVTGVAKDLLGDYHQAQVMAHGDLAEGAVRYYVSYADGASNLDALQDVDPDATAVQGRRIGKGFMGRVELALLGLTHGEAYVESKRDDTGIGERSHLTLGIAAGFQNDIDYATESVADANLDSRLVSVDLAGRYRFGAMGTLTGQMEFVTFERDFNYRPDESPQGGYLQAGYLLPWPLLYGLLEPAARFEVFDRDRVENAGEGGSTERTTSVGVNHYLQKHSLKWSYNFVHTRFDRGVAEAQGSTRRSLHQLLLQLYF